MSKLMVNLRWDDPTPPTPAAVRERFGLAADDLDESFGVVEIDPEQRLYTVLVEASAAARIDPTRTDTDGPYANPRIEPFGGND